MEEKISKLNYFGITGLLLAVLVINFLYWSNALVALCAGVLYIGIYGFVFGALFIAKRGWQFVFGPLLLASLIALVGSVGIYLKIYQDYYFLFLLIVIPAGLYLPYYRAKPREKLTIRGVLLDHFDRLFERTEPRGNIVLVFAYIILAIIAASLLFIGQTTDATQSPWQTVSKIFLPLYFFASLILLTYVLHARRTKLPLTLIVIQAALTTSVAAIVYVVGYGFDPFIHQATERLINQTGQINPTPLYYLGQYSLVVFLHKLTLVDIGIIDRWLVPLTTACLLPLTTFFVFSHWLKQRYALTLSLVILTIPLTSFIMTAPQNLANVFFIVTVLLSLLYFRGGLSVLMLYLLALATLAIHPLAGIPLFIFVALLHLFKTMYESYRQYVSLFFLVAIIFSFALPLAFIVSGSAVSLQTPAVSLADLSPLRLANHFDAPLDLAYLIHWNGWWLAGLIIIIGLAYLAKHKLLVNNAPYLIIALVIFINYLFVRYLLVFPNLGSLDQADFVSRIGTLAGYVLLPIFLIGFHWLIINLWDRDGFTRLAVLFGISGLLVVSLYFAYPRVNQYEPAKFFSVSAADVKAVGLIEQNAAPQHVVLANQMVGAAAIGQFGFKNYYQNEFYYSMPMGSPRQLYELFLAMTYEGAKRETMDQAMAYANVDEAYFVLDGYWRDFDNIAAQATASADEVFTVDNGKVLVFRYEKKQ